MLSWFKKVPQNPKEELLKTVKTAIQNLYPAAEKFTAGLAFSAVPPHIEADYAFSTFFLAAIVQQEPEHIAAKIAAYFAETSLPLIKKIWAVGPYVNVEVHRSLFSANVLSHIKSRGAAFGNYGSTTSHRMLLNHYLPDIMSATSADALRMLLIGNVISRCYERGGDTVRTHCYIPDWDVQKIGFAFALYLKKETVQSTADPIEQLRAAETLLAKRRVSEESLKADQKVFFEQLESGQKNLGKYFSSWRRALLKKIRALHEQQLGSSLNYSTESEYVSEGKTILKDALKSKVVQPIAGTGTLAVLPQSGALPILLAKHNGQPTGAVRHLAFIKKWVASIRPRMLVHISLEPQGHYLEQLLTLSKNLGYIPPDMKIATVAVGSSNTLVASDAEDPAARFAILKTPANEKVHLSESSRASYDAVTTALRRLEQRSNTEEEPDFTLVQLLAAFPDIVTEVRRFHAPDRLCAYLEEVAITCSTKKNALTPALSEAAATVLKNGLALLTL